MKPVLVVAALVALISVTAADAATRFSPKVLALRLSDLPAGYEEVSARYYTNAQVASDYGLSVRALDRLGRIISYETVFRRVAVTGIVRLEDTVVTWKTSGGARWDYSRLVVNARHSGFSVAPVRGVGEEGANSVAARSQKGIAATADIVVFQRSTYRVYVAAFGMTGTFQPQQVIRLARIIDQRIRKVGL